MLKSALPLGLLVIMLSLFSIASPAYAGEVIITIPDEKLERVLADAFRWNHTDSDQSPVYGKSESEKLAYCLNRVINLASSGRIGSLEEIGATVEVRRGEK